jgi:hypothetical protein
MLAGYWMLVAKSCTSNVGQSTMSRGRGIKSCMAIAPYPYLTGVPHSQGGPRRNLQFVNYVGRTLIITTPVMHLARGRYLVRDGQQRIAEEPFHGPW